MANPQIKYYPVGNGDNLDISRILTPLFHCKLTPMSKPLISFLTESDF